jgi:hypothetical protein
VLQAAVDEYRPGLLVDLILDRIAAHRDLDDHIAIAGNVVAGRNAIEIHRKAKSGIEPGL